MGLWTLESAEIMRRREERGEKSIAFKRLLGQEA